MFTFCRNGLWVASSVKQHKITPVTDEDLKLTAGGNNFYYLISPVMRYCNYFPDGQINNWGL